MMLQGCTKDESGPLKIGFQELILNHLKRHGLSVLVVSVKEKAQHRLCQVGTEKTNESEPLMKCREVINNIKTERQSLARDKSRKCLIIGLDGVRHEDGVSSVQALVRNVGTCRLDVKGEVQADETVRTRVPMLGTGAEQPVVAMKRVNARRAKGFVLFGIHKMVNCESRRSR